MIVVIELLHVSTGAEMAREKWGWLRGGYAEWVESYLSTFSMIGAGGGNRTHGLGIMRPSLYH